MTLKTVYVSAFTSPEDICSPLEKGFRILFKEYVDSPVPYDFIELNPLDVVTRWKNFPRDNFGLHQALVENAERLIKWKYIKWNGSRDTYSLELNSNYLTLVEAYVSEMRANLNNYFGINRIIEASSCYSCFLIDESTLLACHSLGHMFTWQSRYAERLESSYKPDIEATPANPYWDQEIEESTSVYSIERKNSFFSGELSRNTVVTINEIDGVDTQKLVYWLNAGYVVEHSGRKLFAPDDDGTVFGTDNYGCDFYAGNIDLPARLIDSLQMLTSSERFQEKLLASIIEII